MKFSLELTLNSSALCFVYENIRRFSASEKKFSCEGFNDVIVKKKRKERKKEKRQK